MQGADAEGQRPRGGRTGPSPASRRRELSDCPHCPAMHRAASTDAAELGAPTRPEQTLTVLGCASAAPWYLQTPGLGFLMDLPAAAPHISSHPRWPQEDEE